MMAMTAMMEMRSSEKMRTSATENRLIDGCT